MHLPHDAVATLSAALLALHDATNDTEAKPIIQMMISYVSNSVQPDNLANDRPAPATAGRPASGSVSDG